MTLKIHMSDHNDDLHSTTAKRNFAGGVVGLQTDSKINSDYLHDHLLTETEFQTNAGTGTAANPGDLNDNILTTSPSYDLNEYVQILFDDYAIIKEFRDHGNSLNEGDGTFKIQHLWGTTWIDNTIDISTRKSLTWTTWKPLTAVVITKGIRLIATLIDTGLNKNYINELEIRG